MPYPRVNCLKTNPLQRHIAISPTYGSTPNPPPPPPPRWIYHFWFDFRVFYPNAESYKGLTTKQIYCQHESEKKRTVGQQGARSRTEVPLPHWYLLPPQEGLMIARGITVDWLNFYQPRKERIIVLQCHGFAPKLIRPLEVCAFVLERLTFYAKSSAEHNR